MLLGLTTLQLLLYQENTGAACARALLDRDEQLLQLARAPQRLMKLYYRCDSGSKIMKFICARLSTTCRKSSGARSSGARAQIGHACGSPGAAGDRDLARAWGRDESEAAAAAARRVPLLAVATGGCLQRVLDTTTNSRSV